MFVNSKILKSFKPEWNNMRILGIACELENLAFGSNLAIIRFGDQTFKKPN